jgi:hypothetical protein
MWIPNNFCVNPEIIIGDISFKHDKFQKFIVFFFCYHLRVAYSFFVNNIFLKIIKSLINMMHNYPSHAYHEIFFLAFSCLSFGCAISFFCLQFFIKIIKSLINMMRNYLSHA